ncbi:hypothetical protein QBC33DRAFT_77198 [Phialemonium atrogriseum]|uniref:Uncharacterized protein n=1 Tax=Phialemonium atrogriseum TaxID=1093897 RepID=A0AAJ0BYZ4_9PEZI|nr:uncharacterized protein QBC33DRAFT_77198 [Phialemonium atrogriseum]KAK1767093.1 hypothetical protein QBC33DRAFT_77198 [Phialemonium atrogriseum]
MPLGLSEYSPRPACSTPTRRAYCPSTNQRPVVIYPSLSRSTCFDLHIVSTSPSPSPPLKLHMYPSMPIIGDRSRGRSASPRAHSSEGLSLQVGGTMVYFTYSTTRSQTRQYSKVPQPRATAPPPGGPAGKRVVSPCRPRRLPVWPHSRGGRGRSHDHRHLRTANIEEQQQQQQQQHHLGRSRPHDEVSGVWMWGGTLRELGVLYRPLSLCSHACDRSGRFR